MLNFLPAMTTAIAGCVGVSDRGDGTYRVDLVDGTSRDATVDEILAAKISTVTESIKTERDRRKELGCPVAKYRFHSDESSRIQQLGLLLFGANMPAGIRWKTMDGTFVDMTPTLAQQIFAAQAQRDMALFSVAEQHIAAAKLAADPLKYDYSANWPD